MSFEGLCIGAAAFLCIGLFHPLVIWAEYTWGVRCWWVFALVGLLCVGGSLLVGHVVLSAILGIVGFSCWWSIRELFQ